MYFTLQQNILSIDQGLGQAPCTNVPYIITDTLSVARCRDQALDILSINRCLEQAMCSLHCNRYFVNSLDNALHHCRLR